jgi:hypothetical protein
MPIPTLFTTEFVLQLQKGYLQQAFSQREILEVNSTGNVGQLSRLFDKLLVSPAAQANAYDCMSEAVASNQIETHMRDVALSIAPFLLNENMMDCSEMTITHMGKDHYEALIATLVRMGASKTLLVDKLLQAIIVSYAQAVTHHFSTQTHTGETAHSEEQMESIRVFNTQFTLPMGHYIAHITQENLFSSFKEEDLQDKVESVQASLLRLSTLVGEFREQLEFLKEITTSSDPLDAITLVQKTLRIQLDKLAEAHEKLVDNPSQPHIRKALTLLRDLPLTLQDIIQNEQFITRREEPFARGWVELCIDTAAWLLTLGNVRYITEETRVAEALHTTREKMQSMKAVLQDIKTSHELESVVNFQV